MPGNTFNPGEYIVDLRQIDILTIQGQSVAEAVRMAGISEQSYYRWRKEYGGLRLNSDKRLKNPEKINQRLKKLLAELFLDKVMLEVVVKGRLLSPERRADSPHER